MGIKQNKMYADSHVYNVYKQFLHEINLPQLGGYKGVEKRKKYLKYYLYFVKNNLKFCILLDLLYFNGLVPFYITGTHAAYIETIYREALKKV